MTQSDGGKEIHKFVKELDLQNLHGTRLSCFEALSPVMSGLIRGIEGFEGRGQLEGLRGLCSRAAQSSFCCCPASWCTISWFDKQELVD